MSNTVVRIIKYEESFEVRVSTFFYFDDNPGRRAVNNRMNICDQPGETSKHRAFSFLGGFRPIVLADAADFIGDEERYRRSCVPRRPGAGPNLGTRRARSINMATAVRLCCVGA